MRYFLPLLAAVSGLAQNPVVIENDWVRVVRAANIPGQLSRPHVHLVNRVMIHLDRGTLRIDNKETGVARDIPFRAGEVRWDPRAGLHTSENTGGTAIRIVEVELKDRPEGPPAKLAKPAARFQVELDNAQVRVLKTTLKPHEQIGGDAFSTPVIAVRLTDGETKWHAAGRAKVTNESDQAADWVFVELR